MGAACLRPGIFITFAKKKLTKILIGCSYCSLLHVHFDPPVNEDHPSISQETGHSSVSIAWSLCVSSTICFVNFTSSLFGTGISLKTQELYVIVFLARYLDLFTRYFSFYNTAMKLFFIGTSVAIVWYMRYHKVVKQTYSREEDTFKHYVLVLLCFILAILIPHSFTVTEVQDSNISRVTYFFCISNFPSYMRVAVTI